MSSFIGGIDNLTAGTVPTQKIKSTNNSAGSVNLEMTDFLNLMVQQFQNQDIENAASTTDMLNQLVQMSVMQAVTNITDATSLMYASSLVGKTVTIGQYGSDGKLQELVGLVTGTGTLDGKPVIFANGNTYHLSDVMAVGTLPETGEETKTDTPEVPEAPAAGESSNS